MRAAGKVNTLNIPMASYSSVVFVSVYSYEKQSDNKCSALIKTTTTTTKVANKNTLNWWVLASRIDFFEKYDAKVCTKKSVFKKLFWIMS